MSVRIFQAPRDNFPPYIEEHHYTGTVRVVNGIAAVTSEEQAQYLLSLGYNEITPTAGQPHASAASARVLVSQGATESSSVAPAPAQKRRKGRPRKYADRPA